MTRRNSNGSRERGAHRAAWFALASVLVALPARAEGPPKETRPAADAPNTQQLTEARSRFNRALELYRDGDLPSALAEFRRADALAPSYRLKYNIGQVCEEQHDYACALSAFQTYLDGGGNEIAHPRRASVESDVQRLSAFVALLTVSVDVPGAEISIDDVSLGTAPLAGPVRVNSGLRHVTAREGDRVATRSVEVAGGQDLQVTLVLRQGAATAARFEAARPEDTDAAPSASADSSRQLFWLSWAATGVLATGTAITGVMALHASHELTTERHTVPTSPDTLAASSNRVSQLALAADILGLVTLGSAACAVHFTLVPGASAARPAAAVVSVGSQF